MRVRRLAFLLLAVAMFAQVVNSAIAVTIYEDDFSGDGLSSLNGTTPDVSLGGGTWASGSNLLNNGVQNGAGEFTALLPFAPLTPGLYTLSADFTVPTGTADRWFAMGFTEELAPAGGGLESRWLDGVNNSRPALWGLIRNPGGGFTDQSFLGYAGGGHTFGGTNAPTTTASSLIITIDTTNSDWDVTWDFNSDGVDRTETVLAADVPNINYVGFTSADPIGTVSLSSFLLDGPAPPANPWNVDGGGSFNVASNWLSNTVPTSDAVFGSILTEPNSPASATLDSAVSLNQVTFANANTYTIDGPSTLTLTGSATVSATAGAHAITAQVSGSNGLNKTGVGTLVLSNGSNNYTGNTNVLGGTLAVTDLGATNQASGVVDVSAGAIFALAGDSLGNGANGTLTQSIQGGGQLVTDRTLTTEVVTLSSANSAFTGEVVVNGGKLRVTNSLALGSTDGTPATGTTVSGGGLLDVGVVELAGVTVSGESLQIAGRQPGQTAPALTSTGNSEWTGSIVGLVGGGNYNIESQAGSTLTLSGDITMPDGAASGDLAVPASVSNVRSINLSGAGNGRIEGQIIDRTQADVQDPADGDRDDANINLVKSGSGTWTIATAPPAVARDGYHQGRTVIDEGTLAVQSSGLGTTGELFSRTIEVSENATFDVSSFTTYSLQIVDDPDGTPSTGDETGQILSGTGTVNVGGGTLRSFDDSSISPGDTIGNDTVANGTAARGTLIVNGNFRHSTFTPAPAGSWDFELGSTTAPGNSDRVVVSGSTTVDAGSAADRINVNISAGEGAIASGNYVLVESNSLSFGGSAGAASYNTTIRDHNGNDLGADTFVTASVQHSGNNIVANISGSRNLNWAGTSGDAWDIKTTSNWSGGGTQFGQLDNVSFGNVANKNVSVDTTVLPGSTTFDGGAGSTYTVTGTGGISGPGPVNVNSGTVQLQNGGNNYAGTTTVASGARLELGSATTGDVAISGTLSVGGAGILTGGSQTFYSDDFSGSSSAPLNETTPDTSFDGGRWVAAPLFQADGAIAANPNGGSATFAFQPIDGSTYVLETSVQGVSGDNDWIATGFASGQSDANSINARFITGDVQGLAWALLRGDASVNENQTFLGDTSVVPNGGLAGGANAWAVGTNQSGGDATIRITLDTTGGEGNWTATWEADLQDGNGFQVITASAPLLDEAINSVGIANSRSDVTGTFTSFSLSGTEPVDSRFLNAETITVDGDLTMDASSILELDIALTGQDFLDVTGSALLDGTIDVTQLGSFTPDNGTQYTLLTAAEGIIDSGVDFLLPTGFSASIIDSTDLVLTFGTLGSAGDFDMDSNVDGADFLLWQRNPGVGSLSDWQATYGNSSSSLAASNAVPEPNSCLLLQLFALTGLAWRRKVDSKH